MARVQTKAEISPATAALVFFLVLAVACFSLWYFVIQQPFPKFSPPAISPTRTEQPSPVSKGSEAKSSKRDTDSGVRVSE
jgi:hypothetical protein